ncbi:MAG: class I SAM-dependent methyltransferase [Treponema sp.]|nr:class I SAM-dependent methyltransferase [Treponema sp.]
MKKNHFVCPWQAGPVLMASRRMVFHNPKRILSPYVNEGMIAMDIGCGMGYFTLPMSVMAGKNGKVIAVDLQAKMLEGLQKYAGKADAQTIVTHQCSQDALHIEQWNGTVDFALVFWMLHEVPDPQRLIRELHAAMSSKGKLLFAEPKMHVSAAAFQKSKQLMQNSGFIEIDAPKITMSRAVLFRI